jgi:hypothetical protein
MSKYAKSKEVLIRAREEIVGELVRTGESGGTGLAQRYAPLLVNLQQAIDVITSLEQPTQKQVLATPKVESITGEPSFAEKMKNAKAAKKLAATA